jgi:hypothetical protein
LEGAVLTEAHLEGKVMKPADLEPVRRWADNFPAQLAPAGLRGAFLDDGTHLNGAILGTPAYGYAICADAHWRGVNLAVVELPPVDQLGDERRAHLAKDTAGKVKDRATRLGEFQAAVRAHRQLAVALQGQGLNEDASRFAYRAQLLQRQVLRRQRKVAAYLGSLLLDTLAGYGYRPGRIFQAYVAVVLSFAATYWAVTHFLETKLARLSWDEALVLSLTSFHGRGFFPGFLALGDWVAHLGAAEAVIGLFIELVLIGTFSRRFLGN